MGTLSIIWRRGPIRSFAHRRSGRQYPPSSYCSPCVSHGALHGCILFITIFHMIDDLTLPVPPVEPTTPTNATPFQIVLERLDEAPNGNFRPGAFVKLTPALRTSGLLSALPAEELRLLVCILTFLSPNGDALPTFAELADALKLSHWGMELRLQALHNARFQKKPVIQVIERTAGLTAYTISPELVTFEQQAARPTSPPMTIQAAPREAVIRASRAQYARPRAEVEQEIAKSMNWEEPEASTPEEKERHDVFGHLRAIGVEKEEALSLLERFPISAIRQQIEWLDFRNASNRARYLVAAIVGNYQAPRAVREQQAGDVAEEPAPTVIPHTAEDGSVSESAE